MNDKLHLHTQLTTRLLTALGAIGNWLMLADASLNRERVVTTIRENQQSGAEKIARAALNADEYQRLVNDLLAGLNHARAAGYNVPDPLPVDAILVLQFAEGNLCERARLSELAALILAGMNLNTRRAAK